MKVKTQRGFSLLQVQLAVLASSFLLAASVPAAIERFEEKIADAAILQVYTVGEAAQVHFQREGEFPDQANACAGAIDRLVTAGYLAGFVQRGGQYVTSWGTPVTTTCTAERFNLQNQAGEARWAQYMAGNLGSAAVAGAVLTASFGQSIAGIVDETRFLFRVAVPGNPAANQLETDVDFNGNSINNALSVTATNITGTDVDLTNIDSNTINNAGTLTTLNGVIEGNLNLADNATLTGGANTVISNTGPGSRTETLALRWGPDVPGGLYSELESGTGSIELGGREGAPAFSQPYIDFHFVGLAENFNSRIQADADGRLTVTTGLLQVAGDQLVTGNARVDGLLEAEDVVLEGPVNRRLSSFLGDAVIVNVDPAGGAANFVPKPNCRTGLTPRIFAVPAQFAQGAAAKPMAQAGAYAQDRGASWEVFMEVLTEDGSAPPEAGYGRALVITQCG